MKGCAVTPAISRTSFDISDEVKVSKSWTATLKEPGPPMTFSLKYLSSVGSSLRIGSPLMTIPFATASSRAAWTGRPLLLMPSPEMSRTRRSPSKPLLS